MADADLREAVAAFVGAFEEVFDRDWEYALIMLSPANIRSFIAPGGTFLNPAVEDEVEDWGARAELQDRYRQLLQVMQRHGIPRSRGEAEAEPFACPPDPKESLSVRFFGIVLTATALPVTP